MSRMNLDALKAVDVNGVPIYQVPILEQYIPKLMKNIPAEYSEIVTKPYKSSRTNYYYIDVLCIDAETSKSCVERIINFCWDTRIIPVNQF